VPADLGGLDVDHAAARDGGGRGDGQVLHLEDHRHDGGHGDHLAGHQAELLVVVEHLCSQEEEYTIRMVVYH